jgi:hypothetical protein
MAQIEITCERREAQRASYGFPANELDEAERNPLRGAWWEIPGTPNSSTTRVPPSKQQFYPSAQARQRAVPGRVYIDAEVIPVRD